MVGWVRWVCDGRLRYVFGSREGVSCLSVQTRPSPSQGEFLDGSRRTVNCVDQLCQSNCLLGGVFSTLLLLKSPQFTFRLCFSHRSMHPRLITRMGKFGSKKFGSRKFGDRRSQAGAWQRAFEEVWPRLHHSAAGEKSVCRTKAMRSCVSTSATATGGGGRCKCVARQCRAVVALRCGH